jgi:hypothetical protein
MWAYMYTMLRYVLFREEKLAIHPDIAILSIYRFCHSNIQLLSSW